MNINISIKRSPGYGPICSGNVSGVPGGQGNLFGDPGNLPGDPRNVCRKGLKFPDIPGDLNWLNGNIILMTINEAYLVALRTVTLGSSDDFWTLLHISWASPDNS